MTPDQLFQQRQAAMPDEELIEKTQKSLSELCNTGGRSLTMSVPPKTDDFDMMVVELTRRLKQKNMKTNFKECPVQILQNENEFRAFLNIYKRAEPKSIIEIGTFFGGTLWFFNQNSKLEKVTVIDLPIPESDERYSQMVESRKLWDSWFEDCRQFYDIKGNSRDLGNIDIVKGLNPEGSVDMLFIDGDHTYEGVKADYENYSPLVRSGGMIVFHDIYLIEEVKRFWKELVSQHQEDGKTSAPFEIIYEQDSDAMGIGILYKK